MVPDSIISHLIKIIKKSFEESFDYKLKSEVQIELIEVPDRKLGDLAFSCFEVANVLDSHGIPIAIAPGQALRSDEYIGPQDDRAAEIAKALANQIESDEYIEKAVAMGPYLNFFLRKEKVFEEVCFCHPERSPDVLVGTKRRIPWLSGHESHGIPIAIAPGQALRSDEYVRPQDDRNKKGKIILEFSSPNTNKPLHLGHLRNIVLGTSIANLLESIGHKVIRANLINDRGIHICKSMLMYERKLKVKSEKLKVGQITNKACELRGKSQMSKVKCQRSNVLKGDHLVGEYYTLFEKESQKNPELLEEAQEMLRKWEAGDKKVLALWGKMNKWALDGFKETYKRLGARFDKWYFESKIYKKGREIILEALKKGKCYQREDGAVEIDLKNHEFARIYHEYSRIKNEDKKVLLRADGTSVYITQDIALAKLKFDQYKPDKSIYLTGHEQEYHFKVLFEILERFGFPWAKKCQHLWHGMVFLPEGKMKSREGKVIEADELMDEMKSKVKSQKLKVKCQMSNVGQITNRACELRSKSQKSGVRSQMSNVKCQMLERIAQAALKFYLLKFSPKQEINFDPEKSLSFEGATGVYVMYAYTRIQSILNKVKSQKLKVKSKESNVKCQMSNVRCQMSNLGNLEEWELAKLLLWFPQIIQKAALNYNPSYLTEYLLKLAARFNKFYEKHSVLSARTSELTKARLCLIEAVAGVLKRGLELLGIETVKKM